MPLTESFLKRIDDEEEKKTRVGPSLGGTQQASTPLAASQQITRPEEGAAQAPDDEFSMMDMAGSALWGAASGFTFGVASAGSTPWEEMGTDEFRR